MQENPTLQQNQETSEAPWHKDFNELANQGGYFEKMALEKGVPQTVMDQKFEAKTPLEVSTTKGSVYKYLPDGKTQRFKTATGELQKPQDVLVFIPPWDLIREKAGLMYPQIFGSVENEIAYEQTLLQFAQLSGKTIRVVDEKGKELNSNAEVQTVKQAFILCVDKEDSSKSFFLPVGRRPVSGWYTYDKRRYSDEKGEQWHEKHIGNKVVEVKY